MMRSLKDDNVGSVIPLVMFILVIIGCGGLYSLFFIEVCFPYLEYMIPASSSKTYVMMVVYAVPLFIVLVSLFALLLSGLKKQVVYEGGL